MTDTPPCILSETAAKIFLGLQLSPWAVSGIIWVLNLVQSGSVFFYYISLWLGFSHYTLYPFQEQFNMIRPEIMCALGQESYKFPSVMIYYVGSVVTIVIVYCAMWPTRTSYMRWVWIGLLMLAPSFVLVWFEFNVWYEVLFSMLWGAIQTTGFMLVMRFFLRPAWPYMECAPPCTWMGLNDDAGWLCEQTNEYRAHRKRIRRAAGLDGASKQTMQR